MKLRIKGNAIRLRLTQNEVKRVAAGEPIRESLQLTDGYVLHYELTHGNEHRLMAHFDNAALSIKAPVNALSVWAHGDAVAVECDTDVTGPSILIEKDFACLTPRPGDDDEDTFPHPRVTQR